MKFPTPERQEKWINDYVAPILLEGNIGAVVQNYRKNKRDYFVQQMEEAGVYESLRKLEGEGTSWDKVFGEMKRGVERAKERKELREIRCLSISPCEPKNLYCGVIVLPIIPHDPKSLYPGMIAKSPERDCGVASDIIYRKVCKE